MPRVKVTDDELDIQELEDAEYNEDEDFDTYTGELPDDNTVLVGYIKSMWWTYTQNNDRMFKVLFVSADNDGDEVEFDGLPIWDNPFFSPAGKFRWKPFIDNFDITLDDVKKKLFLAKEDHPRFGAPVEKVGTLVPGGDTAWARVLTKIGYDQNGTRRVEVKKWLPLEDEDEVLDEEEPDEEPEDLADEEPDDEDDEYDEEDEPEDDEDEDEEDADDEPEPAPRIAARGRRPAPKAAAAKPATRTRAAAKAAPATRTTKAAPARTTRTASTTRRTATKAPAAKATTTRGRRTAKPSSDEPPF